MDLIDTAGGFGQAIYDGITLPGNFVLAKLALAFPGTDPAARGIAADGFDPLPLLISLLAWLLLAVALLRVLRWLKRVARSVSNALAAVSLRLRLAKARCLQSIAGLLGANDGSSGLATGMIEFDDTDIAVLRIANSQPSGYSISVPDLVAHFRVRPSVVEKSLDRLIGHRLLEAATGHTDGFENYRLTSAGAAFARSMQ
jgi:hypothetical protein